MNRYNRTHTCGELTSASLGSEVTLAGWVHRRRDHGGLIFIDLRDRFGLTQVVFRPETFPEAHKSAHALRAEFVIRVHGRVISRGEGMANPKLKTGEIEVEVERLDILSSAKTPPFSVSDEHIQVNEELRLKHRYLDMRRGEVIRNLVIRHRAMQAIRHFLVKEDFIEVTTPLLGKSTPEGARDYLVPSRIHTGDFYALPQSPQLFKQLLMYSGLDRYFQIAPCFRDEDLRADRQPEFHQVDLEMSFDEPETLFPLIEKLMGALFKECIDVTLPTSFPHMPYSEAMETYGTDKPDVRFGMPLMRIDDLAKRSDFAVFQQQNCVKGLTVKGGAELSRRQIDEYTSYVGKFGAHGLAWMKVQEEGLQSSIVKFFKPELLGEIQERMEAEVGDLLLFVASDEGVVNQALDHLRRHIARERKLIDSSKYAFLWITEFPLLGLDPETHRLAAEHHPFTSPHLDDLELLDKEPLKVRSMSYDLVLNGYELGSGSQRIHDSALQEKMFEILQISKEDIEERFGFFVEALKYGTPPTLGIGLGFDRIVMLLCQTENIRDVVAFPKTQKAYDLMMEAPSSVMSEQLTELKIHVGDKR